MKRKLLCCLLLALLLCACFAAPAFADGENAGLGYITDATGSLTSEEVQTLTQTAAAISQKHECGVYVVLLEDYTEYNRRGIEYCAEELYRYFDLGWGADRDGVMLIMSMKQREYDIAAYGDFGNYAFTDYGKDYLSRSFLDDFRRDDWYGGFRDYLDTAESMLDSAREGEPVDLVVQEREPVRVDPITRVLIAILPSSVVAVLFCGAEKRKMKTAVSKRTAEDYVVPGSARLYIREDRFLNRTRTVEVIRQEHRSSGGGGGTTVNSGGFSHHSGKF
ncbi:MAG: TPM domain-containing protein [Oscillospiraceae bacterium]|nr:TPM domain-containing protein [Oscillospiraceae bacterium]